MKHVSRFEANLLRVLHCILGRIPVEQALPIVLHALPRPRCLSREAVALVQDALAKGCVQWLARNGGWRRERHLRGERAVDGRLWDRTPQTDLNLNFSRHSLAFLIWLTAARPGGAKSAWRASGDRLTMADRLLVFLAYKALRGTEAGAGLRALPAVHNHVPCRLAFPQDFVDGPALTVADFLPSTKGLGASFLEVLQHPLARGWVQLEAAKARITDWETMQALGHAQEQVLLPYLDALAQAARFDLARFVLEALVKLLPATAAPRFWVGGLVNAGPRLADRTGTHQAALAFVRQMERLKEWERQARGVGYLDAGYAASQLWKQDWERCQGDVLHARAQALTRQLDPLHSLGGAES